jgi:hypothetical protein
MVLVEKNTSAQSRAQRHLDINVLEYVAIMKRKEKCSILAVVVSTMQLAEAA